MRRYLIFDQLGPPLADAMTMLRLLSWAVGDRVGFSLMAALAFLPVAYVLGLAPAMLAGRTSSRNTGVSGFPSESSSAQPAASLGAVPAAICCLISGLQKSLA